MSRMIPGELDAGKPPVQFDEGLKSRTRTDNYGRFKLAFSALAYSTCAREAECLVGESPTGRVRRFTTEDCCPG
jgi:hypothetical protein